MDWKLLVIGGIVGYFAIGAAWAKWTWDAESNADHVIDWLEKEGKLWMLASVPEDKVRLLLRGTISLKFFLLWLPILVPAAIEGRISWIPRDKK